MFYTMITWSADPVTDDSFETMYSSETCPAIEEILEKSSYYPKRYIWIIERDEFSTELQRMPVWSDSGAPQLRGWRMQPTEIIPEDIFDDTSNIVYVPLPTNDVFEDDRLQEKHLYY